MSDYRIANRAFNASSGGQRVDIAAGERVHASHEIVAEFPEFFESEDQHRRREQIRTAAQDPRNREAGADFGNGRQSTTDRDPRPGHEHRDTALRAIERCLNAGGISSRSADHLEDVSTRDRTGLDAQYIAAVANPDYARAFGRILTRPTTAQYEMSREEAEALRVVADIDELRAMNVGTTTAGKFGLPISIDPTMNLTSDGVMNPLRQVATVRTITTSEWRGVTTAGVTAAFGAESSEVADGTPTLAQPIIIPERATAFVPFSFEVGMDYPQLSEELGKLFSDAKDVLECTKFTLGAGHGSTEPQGIIAGATGTVAAGTAAFAVAHGYALQEALPARFEPRASWLANQGQFNRIRQFDTAGGASLWETLGNGLPSTLLGYPVHRLSPMVNTLTAGSKILAFGDLKAAFEIVDRVGMSVELVPHLMGASGRPIGQRGLLAWWRTSSGIVNQAALRVSVTT